MIRKIRCAGLPNWSLSKRAVRKNTRFTEDAELRSLRKRESAYDYYDDGEESDDEEADDDLDDEDEEWDDEDEEADDEELDEVDSDR